jgi:uroporphyrinogen decarboxylase
MAETTSLERVLTAVAHQQPDRVPYYFSFTHAAAEKLQAYYGEKDLDHFLENDMVRHSIRRPSMLEEVRPGCFRDEFGVVWNRTIDRDIGIPDNQVLPERTLRGYQWPDPLDPRRYADLPGFIEAFPGRFRFISFSMTLFERAWSMRGLEAMMIDMVEAPEWVEEFFDALIEFQLVSLREYLKYDVHGVLFGDDWGQQQGLLFSPATWRRFFKPRMARLASEVKAAGKVAMHHSCGKVQSLFPDMIEIGIDVFNPFQPDVMDVYEIKRQYGDMLTFYGGVSVQSLLPLGTPGEVRDEVKRLMEEVGQGGGFIIAPSHHMPGDIPVENMVAFIDAVRGG